MEKYSENSLEKRIQSGLKELISKEKIAGKVKEYAKILDQNYPNNNLIILMIMKGAICLTADLIRAMNTSPPIQHINCSSYGSNGSSRGELKISGLDKIDVKGKHVLLVDDICDSGFTMKEAFYQVSLKDPLSVKTMALLLRKAESPSGFVPDYSLFDVERDDFLVGYGLDYKERFRGLSGIYTTHF